MLGLRFCVRAFSSCGTWGATLHRGARAFSLSRPLLLRSTGSRRAGSVVVAHGPSCSVARGIFPDQGSNPCPLHWQADSQPLRHQGSPILSLFNFVLQWFSFLFAWFFFAFFNTTLYLLIYLFLAVFRSLLQCMGFSLQWLLLLRSTDSRLTGFSSCSMRAQ